MTSNYKLRKKQLHNIIQTSLTPTQSKFHTRLLKYYKNRKVSHLFIKNSLSTESTFNVVCQYICNKNPCNRSQAYTVWGKIIQHVDEFSKFYICRLHTITKYGPHINSSMKGLNI